jgi:hypothetical protein
LELTRKEKLLIYCLGRETTVYSAAEAWTGKKGTKIKNLGPWYACKTELIKEGLIKEGKKIGREQKIKANINKFLETSFHSTEEKKMYSYMLKKYVIRTFGKYISKIIDFLMDLENDVEGSFFEDYSRPDILSLFTVISMSSCDEKKLKQLLKRSNIADLYDNIMMLTKGDSDFKDFPKMKDMKYASKWGFSFLIPRIKKVFSESERRELCVYNLLSKSEKRIKKFMFLIYELMPEKAYKNYALSQVKKRLNPDPTNQ